MFELLGEWAARWIIRVTTFTLIVVTVYAVVETIFHFAGAVMEWTMLAGIPALAMRLLRQALPDRFRLERR